MKPHPRLSPRACGLILLALGLVAFVAHQSQGARLTMANAGIVVQHLPQHAALMLVCASGMVLVGVFSPSLPVRGLAWLLALSAAYVAVGDLSFHVTVGRDGLSARAALREASLPWVRVAKVENEPSAVVLVDLAEARLRLDLGALTAQQRAAFDRTLARRIWESGPGHGAN